MSKFGFGGMKKAQEVLPRWEGWTFSVTDSVCFLQSVGGGGREISISGEGKAVNPGSLARCEKS